MQSLRLNFLVGVFMFAVLAVSVSNNEKYPLLQTLLDVGVVHTAEAVQDGENPSDPTGCGNGELCNPLKSTSITDFLLTIIEVILIFAIPIVVLFIMYAGFLYVTSQGDEAKIKKAHSALTWAIVGGVIILGANLIIKVIQGTVETLGK